MRGISAVSLFAYVALVLSGADCHAQSTAAAASTEGADVPLQSLPYTPGLDVSAMDRTANPCADLYQYACGGWRDHNPIPPDQASWSVYGKLYQDNQRFLWGILDGLARATIERTASQQKIGDFFAASMAQSGIERLGAQPLIPSLTRIAGLQSKHELPALLVDLQLQTHDAGFLFRFDSN